MSAARKKIIIVAPHFPPSNLAAVHRSRLFSQHLPSFGWEPIVVTVHHRFYEEGLDWNLAELVPDGLRVERVAALPVRPVRLIGDVGIRGFWWMYKKIVSIVETEGADFLYIPIPSNFAALLGTLVHRKTRIPYGIDYIDPWVHEWPGTDRMFSKHWWSMKLSQWLEPVAVRNACLITGVAPGYYSDMLKRNPEISGRVVTASMPYGGESADHQFARSCGVKPYLFEKQPGKFDLVYAGAMLPRAYAPLAEIFGAIADDRASFGNVRLHFIGTGKSADDPGGHNIKALAERFGLYDETVYEYPRRIPYLDVLAHLEAADGIFILGSTEPHYTPSKVYQAILAQKPIFAVLHADSTACAVVQKTGSGVTISFDGEAGLDVIGRTFGRKMDEFLQFASQFDPARIDRAFFDEYSAHHTTGVLVRAVEECLRDEAVRCR